MNFKAASTERHGCTCVEIALWSGLTASSPQAIRYWRIATSCDANGRSVKQHGPKTGAVSGKSIRKKHHYYLATALIRRNVKIEIQNMISIRWKLSGWKTCFREPENPNHPRILVLLIHRRWARPNMKHKHWHDCNNETQLLTADQYTTAAHHMFSATVTSGKNPCHCNKPQEAQQKLKT